MTIEQKKKLGVLIENLRADMNEICEYLDVENDLDLEDTFADGYPFDKDFDELTWEVYKWSSKINGFDD